MVLLKVGLVLAVIIVLLRRKVAISLAMFAGVAALGLTFWPGPGKFASAVWHAAIDWSTFDLMTVVALVLILSHLLHTSGQFQRMMDALTKMVSSSRVRLAAMPALIGLLPMPGGARFSAPMVDSAANGMGLDVHKLSVINYWFRHIWEYSWPLYPGLLLASDYVGNGGVAKLALAQLPLSIAAIIAGVIFVMPRDLQGNGRNARSVRFAAARSFLINFAPILAVLMVYIILTVLMKSAGLAGDGRPGWLPKRLPMMIALALSSVWVIVQNRTGFRTVAVYIFLRKDLAKMLAMVLSVMIFSGVFNRLDASSDLARFFNNTGIPLVLAIPALTFTVGLLTSVTYVYIALTFPLIVSLLPAGSEPLPYLVLGFCFGFLACMLSPLHLCLLLTKEYFQADFKPIYRDMIAPVLLVAAAGVTMFMLLK
jgi:uncharacterized protein